MSLVPYKIQHSVLKEASVWHIHETIPRLTKLLGVPGIPSPLLTMYPSSTLVPPMIDKER